MLLEFQMAKNLAAIFGILSLLIPWLFSVASVAQFNNVAAEIQSDVVGDQTAKAAITGVAYGYILSGLSALMGVIVLGFCVDGLEYRPRWMFWVILILGLIWLPFYAAGTMLGLALIIYASFNYRRFHPTGIAS